MAKTSKAGMKQALISEMQNMAAVVGGVIAGTVAINAAEKAFKVNASSKLYARLASPLILAAGSAVVSFKVKNEHVKRIALGTGAAGLIKTMKAVAPNTPMLSGLGSPDSDNLGLTPTSAISQNEDWVYRDPSGHLAFPDLGEADDLGEVEPPSSSSGHYIDAPAYLGQSRDDAGILGIEDAQIL